MHLVKSMLAPAQVPAAAHSEQTVLVRLSALQYAIETLDEQPDNCATFDELRAVAANPTRHQPPGEHHARSLADTFELLVSCRKLLHQQHSNVALDLAKAPLSVHWTQVLTTLQRLDACIAKAPMFDEQAELTECRRSWMASQGRGGVYADYWQGWRARSQGGIQ